MVTVDLADAPGARFTSTVVGLDPADVAIAMAVELDWIDRYGAPFPVFRGV